MGFLIKKKRDVDVTYSGFRVLLMLFMFLCVDNSFPVKNTKINY